MALRMAHVRYSYHTRPYYRLDVICYHRHSPSPRIRRHVLCFGDFLVCLGQMQTFVSPEGCTRVHFVLVRVLVWDPIYGFGI